MTGLPEDIAVIVNRNLPVASDNWPELHPPLQTGVIDIGAHTLRLDIYELNRMWQSEKLESLSRPFNLGVDVFRNGFVAVENIGKLVAAVGDYREKIAGYGAGEYRIIATSALREAFNKELIIDRFADAGMKLEILEGTTEVTLTYLAIQEVLKSRFEDSLDNTVMLIMGSGSLFVIGVVGKLMRFCEEIPTGTMRMNDVSGNISNSMEQLRELLKAQRILRRLDESMRRLDNAPVSLVIAGNAARKLAAIGGNAPARETDCASFSAKEFARIIDRSISGNKKTVNESDPETIVELAAAAVIVRHFFESMPCREVICPGMTTRGAVIRDWIRRSRAPGEEPFRQDLAAVCAAIGRKYDFDISHAENVAVISCLLFNKLRSFFSFPAHSGLMLEAAGFLHDIGRFIDARRHHRHSWYLIANTRLPGLTASEQRIVAAAVRYHGRTLPRENHPEYSALSADEKVAVLKLAAILRVADALDLHTGGDSSRVKFILRGRVLKLVTDLPENSRCKFVLREKCGLFEQVFGLELQLQFGEL